MGAFARGRFDRPDGSGSFEHGTKDDLHLAGSTASLTTFEPGWRWSTSVKPLVGTNSCQVHHLGYVLSGVVHVVTDEGEEFRIAPGDAYEILPGHEGWVVGDETFRAVEFESARTDASAERPVAARDLRATPAPAASS